MIISVLSIYLYTTGSFIKTMFFTITNITVDRRHNCTHVVYNKIMQVGRYVSLFIILNFRLKFNTF